MRIWSIEIKELGKLHESLNNQFPDLEKELTQLIKSEVEKLESQSPGTSVKIFQKPKKAGYYLCPDFSWS